MWSVLPYQLIRKFILDNVELFDNCKRDYFSVEFFILWEVIDYALSKGL